MKFNKDRWWQSGIVTAALWACSIPAWSQEATDQEQQGEEQATTREDQQEQTQAERPKRKLQVFQLKHCNAREIEQMLSLASQLKANREAAQNAPAGPEDGRVTVGFRGTEPGTLASNLSIAISEEPNLLFVRGSDADIKAVEQLIKALDVPQEQVKKQTIGHIHVLPVKGEHAGQIDSVLAQLQLDAHAVQLGDRHLIVVAADESEEAATNLQQVEEVVSRLGQEQAQPRDESERSDAEESSAESREADRQD
jgi:hypothetical protein